MSKRPQHVRPAALARRDRAINPTTKTWKWACLPGALVRPPFGSFIGIHIKSPTTQHRRTAAAATWHDYRTHLLTCRSDEPKLKKEGGTSKEQQQVRSKPRRCG